MTPEEMRMLSDLLEKFISTSSFEMGSDEDRTLMDASYIIDEHL